MARGCSSCSSLDGDAPPFEMPVIIRKTDAPPSGDHGATPALGAVALVGGGRAVPVGGGGTVVSESSSPPEDAGRTPTTGARPLPGAARRLRWRNRSVGASFRTPGPWTGSARTGRRPLARPAWKQWAARRVPSLAGLAPAWDRTDQWTRCSRGGGGVTAPGVTESVRGHTGRRGPGTVAAFHSGPLVP